MPVSRTVNRNELLEAVRQLEPTEFEALIADLYNCQGYSAQTTQDSYDNGRDVIVRRRFLPGRELIQVKRYSDRLIRGPDVEQYSGLYSEPGYVRNAVLITSGPVTDEAENVADRRGVELIDQDELPRWMLDMDSQLSVISQYIDPKHFVKENWFDPPEGPSFRVLVLTIISIGAMVVLAGGSIIHPVSSLSQALQQTIWGGYIGTSFLIALSAFSMYWKVSSEDYASLAVGTLVTTAIHVLGLLISGYWYLNWLADPDIITTDLAGISGSPNLVSGFPMPFELVIQPLEAVLAGHLLTALVVVIGFLYTRWALRLQIKIE